ncbi:SAM-dependent methyltransferase [Saccharothrix deserti]|uniref:SAM-dependent methyltransferase n=1 Tax=Saccharothrix deserti TaxID=2593674 RepID=UPI00131AF310|nr:SAM-dependent methyltransferase [Saccharothrix deserti]
MATQRGALGLDAPIDLDAPSLARIYDYLLGGGHNFAADRVVADKIAALVPGYGVFVRENSMFRRRAVLHMLAAGIEQFLDVGTGVFSTRPLHHLDD